ncbi:MAG: ABC transporter ATP-binding protein [Actinomycetaceae bacterium]|nr:ABC transporter ATP-binding protein [Actinomycetaceae bacterium]
MNNEKIVCSMKEVNVAYHDMVVLRDINVDIPAGVIMGIIGPNGAGKSTLIKAALGIVPRLTGKVSFFDQPLDKVRKSVGYMPQAASVDWDFPATVADVVKMGTYASLGWLRRPGRKQKEAVEQALEFCGIADLAHRQIGQLSGGQRQRTFLARTLAQNPDLCFMDEPFAGVDARSEEAIRDVLLRMQSEGKTIVVVHHDLTTVDKFCSDLLILNKSVLAWGPLKDTLKQDVIDKAYSVVKLPE